VKNTQSNFDIKATLALGITVLCWSSVPLFLKFFTTYLDGWTTNGLRYPFAALLLLPFVISAARKGTLTRKVLIAAIIPSVINLIGQVLWAWAPYYVDPGLLSFTVRLSTVWSVGAFFLFPDERALIRSWKFWAGTLLSLYGFFLIISAGRGLPQGAKLTGIFISLACSVFWGAYGLSVRKYMHQVESKLAFGIISLYTGAGTLILMFLFGNFRAIASVPLPIFGLILLSALVGIATAHVLFYVAVKRIGVAIANTFNLLSAFLTAVLSSILFHELINGLQWVGGIVLVLGASFLILAQTKIKEYQQSLEQ
jgi:drug/metabolite transporter (DMT)-like permease